MGGRGDFLFYALELILLDLLSVITCSQTDSSSTDIEERLLLSYTKARIGQVVTGVISKISTTDGITVHYANKVKALVPMPLLVKQGVLDPLEAYRVGQVVKAVIVSTRGVLGKAATVENKGSRVFRLVAALHIGKLSSTLKTAQSLGFSTEGEDESKDGDEDDAMDEDKDQVDEMKDAGQVMGGIVTKIKESGLTVRLQDSREGILPKAQCTTRRVSCPRRRRL